MASLALRPCPRDHRAQSLSLQMRKLRTPGLPGTCPGPASLPLTPTRLGVSGKLPLVTRSLLGPQIPLLVPAASPALSPRPNLTGWDSHTPDWPSPPPAPVTLSEGSFSSSRLTMYITPLPCCQALAQSWGTQRTHNQAPPTPCSLIPWPPCLTHTRTRVTPELLPVPSYLCGFAQAVVSSWERQHLCSYNSYSSFRTALSPPGSLPGCPQ